MSNPQQIDWSSLKTAAIALQSVQDAARRASNHLPESEQRRFIERVNKRAYRERWLDKAKALSLSAPTNAKPLSSPVQSGSDILSTKLKERSDRIKTKLAEVAENASDELLKKKGNALLKQHQAFKNFVGGSGQLLGWEQNNQGGSISLNILTGQAAVQINTKPAQE